MLYLFTYICFSIYVLIFTLPALLHIQWLIILIYTRILRKTDIKINGFNHLRFNKYKNYIDRNTYKERCWNAPLQNKSRFQSNSNVYSDLKWYRLIIFSATYTYKMPVHKLFYILQCSYSFTVNIFKQLNICKPKDMINSEQLKSIYYVIFYYISQCFHNNCSNKCSPILQFLNLCSHDSITLWYPLSIYITEI